MSTKLGPSLTPNFDVLLACLFPLALIFVGCRSRILSFSWSDLRDLLFPGRYPKAANTTYFSLERAYHSYLQYGRLSESEASRMRSSYASLGRAHKNLGYKIGYPQKLDKLRDVTSLNATIAEDIAELALQQFPSLNQVSKIEASPADLGRVRESLKHYIRDWSEEGAEERTRIFTPIMNLLKLVEPDERAGKKVLVPGSGLGRLAWEISELGFDTTANELSYFMTLAFRLLLSPEATKRVNEHKLRPYAHWFSHQRSNDSLFRSIAFPDTLPRLSSHFRLLEADFLTIPSPTGSPIKEPKGTFWSTGDLDSDSQNLGGYDFVVTLFFIDTATNVFATMEQIYKLLRPGGSWVNLGPLLWTGCGQSKLELSLDELLQAAEEVGFNVQRPEEPNHPEARKTVECEYTGDPSAMMRWIYKAEFWVAEKSK